MLGTTVAPLVYSLRHRACRAGFSLLYTSPRCAGSTDRRRGTPRGLASSDHDWLVAGPLRRAFEFPPTLIPEIVANDFLFLRGVAAAGGGIATLPTFIAQPYLASGDLVRVLPSVRVNVGGLVLLYSSTRPLARKVGAFRDFLVEVTQREWVG